MEQTWFDLPVESRLTEVWPKGLLKKSKMITHACKPAEMSFPMPYWNLPVVPMDQKMPLLPGPKDLYHLARSKLGEKLWGCEDSEFSLNEFIQKEIFNAYEILHDPNLAHFLRRPKIVRRLKELGLVDSQMGVMCNLRDYNYYRRYLAFVHNNAINKLYKEQFSKGDNNLEVAALTVNLEKQNAKARVDEEIEQRHAEVFKEISAEKKKKDAVCQKRLRRVEEVFQRRQSNREARRIAAREAAKDFTRKVKENLYYANAQLRQHKLDTMRKWRKQNTEKTALFEEMKKKKQEDSVNKKTEWFQNKIKHQEKRVLQETQINVLMDHEFSPEYKRYLKYIKRENYKNPPAQTAGPEYRVSSESEIEDTDLLNQLRLFTKAGYQLQRGSFISRVQARQSVAKLANLTSKAGSYAQVRRMSEKFMKEKQNMKSKKRQSVLDALINSSILRLLSPSLQDVFKKSESKWKNKKQKAGKSDKIETDAFVKRPSAASDKLPTLNEVVNVDDGGTVNVPAKSPEESLKEDEEEEEEGIGLDRDSEIEIRPPNKTIPPPPICHLNVYRYFDRVIGKVILEYVTRILLPKFPEIINRCHWVSKAEGLPDNSNINQDKPPCHPEDSRQSYTECMELMRDSCDKKMACYLLLYSESPDIRLFRHKFNGIGEITCPESLVGNFLVQSSPHPQHILDYIHWRANWILNYPPPKTYQEIYDLKYVIGVMKNIECPVFQPIYKLWEITNDINLNPEVLDKFVLHMEKKREQKPMVELNPVEIAVKNVRKIIGPLTMDYKITKEVDDYCLKDIFKVPSELFRMSYLKKPVDPRIWKILDELLDKTKRRPEDLECLRCLPDKLKQNLSQIEDYEEIEQTAAESLFIDSRDYTEELKKAKDKDKEETTDSPHIRFGITEFIPYVEAQLFGKEKGYYVAPEAEEDSLDKGGKDKVKKKRPSILRVSRSSLREKRKSSSRLQKRDSSRGSRISHQRKETNLAAKMHSASVDGRKSQTGRKKSPTEKDDALKKGGKEEPAQEKERSTASKEPKSDAEEKEALEEDEGSDVTVETKKEPPVETSKAIKTKKAGKPDKTDKTAKTAPKDGKDKKKKGKVKNPNNEPKSTAEEKTEITPPDNEGGEKEETLALKKGQGVQESKIKFKDANEEKKKRENKELIVEPVKELIIRTKSLSIMKSPDNALSLKTDLNVKFTSKKYVDPHIWKTLDVTDDLKKSKDRAPTPHPSFTSFQEEMQIPKKLLEEAQKHEELSNILKYKECAKEPESDEVLTEVTLFPRRPSETNIRHRTTDTSPKIEDLTKLKKTSVTPDPGAEIVLNVIQPDIAEGQEEEVLEEEKSFSSIGSDIEHLRKFVLSKLPHKFILQEKSYDEESGTEAVPVPPIINKSLLTRRRIIKRPLANILRKIYGWVMTTVIRRRLLISYGLPPKIQKECFYKKKFDPNNLDLARGLAKLILEEPSEFYPFAVLEPYIETILEQTMDPSKRFNFTKRVIRMAQPLTEENLDSLKQFLGETEKDSFYKKARTRRLKKFTMCLRMRLESIHNYRLLWGSNNFNPLEWEEIFSGPKLEDLSYMCTKRKRVKKIRKSLIQQQKSAFVSYGGDSPDPSSTSSSSTEEEEKKEERASKTMTRSERAASRKSREVSMWLKENVVKKDSYDEWKPGFTEKKITSRQKVLDIVINKVADVAPSITDVNDEMRHDFSHHKVQRRWMEKERQFRFITNLNMFSPILPPKVQDRKLMKFVQSEYYPYFGTFLTCQTYSERRYHSQLPVEQPKTPKGKLGN